MAGRSNFKNRYLIVRLGCLLLLCNLYLLGLAQSTTQKNLFSNFISYSGYSVLNAFAHPTCTVYSTSVEAYSDHTYYVKVYYQYGSQEVRYFTCEYKIKLNYTGNFISLEKYSCGSSNASCFGACNFFKDLVSRTTSEDKDRFEKYLYKTLSEFSCEDYCHARLFYKWVDLGYYKEY